MPDYGIELWPGYETSIRQHENSLLMNVDIRFKFMRLATVYELFHAVQLDKSRMSTVACGQIVITDHNNKTYRIDSVDFTKSPLSTFECKGVETTYLDYYKSRYNLTIRDPKQPLLVSKATKTQLRSGIEEFFLVPELCRLTGLTDGMRSDFRLMRAVADHTRMDPQNRQNKLKDFSDRILGSADSKEAFKEFGMQMEPNLVRVKGRVLNPETILFNNNRSVVASRADWTSSLQSEVVYNVGQRLKRWWVVAPAFLERETRNLVNVLHRVLKGVDFDEPTFVILPSDRPTDYLRELDNICRNDPEFVMCVLASDDTAKYSALKKKLSVERGILSQFVLKKTITSDDRKLMSAATKILVQINTKRGFAPWKVAIPLSGLMTIGFDVCHDTRDRSRSFAAFIASMDQSKSDLIYSCAKAHTNGEELSNSFGQMTAQALQCWQRVHGSLPARIVVYRDGVGDGQIDFVLDHEVAQLRALLTQLYGSEDKVQLAFIIVTKRINTRFFAGKMNPPAGTLVDDVVTLPERFDFYLVAQNVNQGTATPTNYNVIYSTLKLKPRHFQELTYKLCHLYYNWSGTVRVPSVCQYAHKFSLLVGQYLHEEPHPALSQKLHFL